MGTWQAKQVPLKVYAPPGLLAVVTNLKLDGNITGQLVLNQDKSYQSDLTFAVKTSFSISLLGTQVPVAFDVNQVEKSKGTYKISGNNLILLPDSIGAVPDTVAFTASGDSLHLIQPAPLGSYQSLVAGFGAPLAVVSLSRLGQPPVSGPITADFSGDGLVDFTDFLSFISHFGAKTGETKYDALFDLNKDGAIDFSDFLSFAAQFGQRK